MRPQLSVSSTSHKLLSRSPSPIISTQDRILYKLSSNSPQVPLYLQSSPFQKANSFLNSPNNTNSAVKQLHLLSNIPENTQQSLFFNNNSNFQVQKEAFTNNSMIPFERIKALEAENNQLNNQISLLNGMNQTKENYIKELEEKISNLYSDNRKEEETSYALKKKEEHFSIILKEQKKLFDNKEKILLKELEDFRFLLTEKSHLMDFFDKSNNNSKDLTKDFTRNSKEFTKNVEIEKSYLESTLKIYKINIAELETKILVLNNENNKLTKMLNEKLNETIEINRELETKLRNDFEGEREEIEGKLMKILEENKKIVTFNNSLLAELEHYKGINESLQKKHENHVEELKNSLKNQTEKKIEDLKNKNNSEKKNFENQIHHTKEFSSDLERRYQSVLEENNRIRGLLLEKDNQISEIKEKLSYLEVRFKEEEKNDRVLCENLKKMKELEEKNSSFSLENRKIREIMENSQKEIDIWKEKYISSNELHLKIVEDLKSQLETRKNIFLESEIKQKTSHLENENNFLKTKVLLFEAEKKGFEEKFTLFNEEREKFEELLYERMQETATMNEKIINNKEKLEEFDNQKVLLNGKDEKILHLEDNLSTLLTENNKLNQAMKVSINERELLMMKFEAYKQENSNKFEELKLKHSREKSFEITKEIEVFKGKLAESERKNEVLLKELKQLNNIQDNLNQNMDNYSSVLIEKDNEIEILREENIMEKTRNDQSRLNQEKILLEKEQLVQKIHKIEENQQVQLKELRNNIKAAELTFEDKKKMELDFNKEVSLHRESLKLAKERLLECHRMLLSFKTVKNDDLRNNFSNFELQKNLEEAERTIFYLKDILNEKDTINPYNKNMNFNEEMVDFWDDSHSNLQKQEIGNKLIEIEKEHTKCYEDLRGELEFQIRNHTVIYNKLKEEYENYQKKCSIEHINMINSLENQMKGLCMEKEDMRREIDRLRGEINVILSNCEVSNNELRFNFERDCENRVKMETFPLINELNEVKRVIFELENDLMNCNQELQSQKSENSHLMKKIEIFHKRMPMNNNENYRNVLGNIENNKEILMGRNNCAIEKFKENEVLKARINELENLNKSFDSLKVNKIGEFGNKIQGSFGKQMNLLSENERLNAQILKRCREILK